MKSKNKYETEIEMELNILATLGGITSKIVGVLGTLYGWVISIIASIIAYFAGLKTLFIILNVILLADFIFGIWSAKIQKKHITSGKLRSTMLKTMIYGVIISLTYAVELSIGTLIVYKILFAIASLIEMYSITANLLIIKPNMPFLKFFSRLVSGEIAEKLGISESEVENTLTNKNITGGTSNDNNN